jgi:uncharacterized repeat protein (TIGR01451 family)
MRTVMNASSPAHVAALSPMPKGHAAVARRLRCGLLLALLACACPAFAQAVDVQVSISNTPDRGPDDLADDTYRPGDALGYTVRVHNGGPTALRDARVVVPLPAGIASASWTCRAEDGVRCGQDAARGAIDDPVTLPVDGTITYRFEFTVPAAYPNAHPQLDVQASLQLPPGVRATDPGRLVARDVDAQQQTAGLPAPQGEAPRGQPTVSPTVAPALGARSSGMLGGQSRGGLGARLGLAAAGPVPTCGPEMFISQAPTGNDNTTLSIVNTNVIPFTLTALGTGSVPYNAVGFRPADSFLYGIRIGTNRLVRIYSDGSTELLNAVSGLPATFPSPPQDNSYNSGEIGTDGFLYVKTQSTVSAIYRIDLSNLPNATATRINLTGGTVSGADFAWINNRLYTVNQNGTVAWIDPGTGAVTTLPVANGALGNVGALFGTPTALFGSRNDPGGFYQFDLTTGRATRLSGSPVVGSNDGAHCASAAIVLATDVGVTKTNTPAQGPSDLPSDTYLPGTNIVYSIVVSNRGPVGVAGLRVQDTLPAGVTTATWTCAITQGQGTCGQASGSGAIDTTVDLEFDEATRVVGQATYTLTVSVPVDYPLSHPALTNTTTIQLPTGYTDSTPGDNTATDTDPAAQTDLRVVKTTPSTSLRVGETITYTLTADNLGPMDVTNAVLSDTPNSHLDCLTPTAVPTCVATGAAACPAPPISRSQLLGAGVIVPSLPANNGQVAITVTCTVTP